MYYLDVDSGSHEDTGLLIFRLRKMGVIYPFIIVLWKCLPSQSSRKCSIPGSFLWCVRDHDLTQLTTQHEPNQTPRKWLITFTCLYCLLGIGTLERIDLLIRLDIYEIVHYLKKEIRRQESRVMHTYLHDSQDELIWFFFICLVFFTYISIAPYICGACFLLRLVNFFSFFVDGFAALVQGKRCLEMQREKLSLSVWVRTWDRRFIKTTKSFPETGSPLTGGQLLNYNCTLSQGGQWCS